MAHPADVGAVAVVHEAVRGKGEGDPGIQVAGRGGGVTLLIEALVHIGGFAGTVAQTAVGGSKHRTVLGILAQTGVQGDGGKSGNAPQGVEPVHRPLKGLAAHLANGVGGGDRGGHVKDLVGHGVGILTEQLRDLLFGQLGQRGGTTVPIAARRPGSWDQRQHQGKYTGQSNEFCQGRGTSFHGDRSFSILF